MSTVLITGATAGIGYATSELLASRGHTLILVGRREERLQKMKASLKTKIETFAFDIGDRKAVEEFLTSNKKLVDQVDVLVNNAGLALGVDFLQEGSLDDWDRMIDTNVKGLLYLTRGLLPQMVKAKRGHIVNLGSIAGKYVYPRGNVYCATKYAVRALSEGLRMDLLGTGIRVTNIEPGMVNTEFSEVRWRSKEKADQVYQGMTPLVAKDIAETIVWCMERPAHVNIQELVIFPTDQASATMVHRRND